ncbi:MAG: phage tail tip lysozyme [Cyanobacteria bacterium J06560_5]
MQSLTYANRNKRNGHVAFEPALDFESAFEIDFEGDFESDFESDFEVNFESPHENPDAQAESPHENPDAEDFLGEFFVDPSLLSGESSATRITPHFTLGEFRSKDGVPVPSRYRKNVRRLAQNLEVLRSHLGRPINVVSGYRSPAHNKKVGGVKNSQHMLAKAADIRVTGLSPTEIYCAIEQLIAQGKMQQGGLGIYRSFVHYDVRNARARWKGSSITRTPKCQLSPPSPNNPPTPSVPTTPAAFDVSRAVTRNRHWGERLGWISRYDEIVKLLHNEPFTPNEEQFALLVHRWQRQRGLTADGIIGPNTWSAMQADLRVGGTPVVVPSSGGNQPATRPTNWAKVPADQRMRYVMKLLVERYGFSPNAAAGIVGNLAAESGVLPNRVEGSSASTPMRARNFAGRRVTFSAAQIANRSRSARRGPKLPGVGLAQWTHPVRRQRLFQHRYKGQILGSAILFSMDAQVDFLVRELRTSFKGPCSRRLKSH